MNCHLDRSGEICGFLQPVMEPYAAQESILRNVLLRGVTLSALMLVLLITQAASFVCGAQCVQHQAPATAHATTMAHCHDMQMSDGGSAVQALPRCATPACAMALPLTHQEARAEAQASQPSLLLNGLIPGVQAALAAAPTPATQRSRPGVSPPLPALRV
jgi:hypothetical protein